MFSEKFISATKERNTIASHVAAPYMRKTLFFDTMPEELTITVCGLGFYDIYVNGEKITKGLMAPYISNPDDICYYDKYDLAPYIKIGKNVIAFILGNGFKNNEGGAVWDYDKAIFIGPPQLAFAIEGKIGEESFVYEADETVKVAKSPIIYDDYRNGVHYDARLEIENWNGIDYDDWAWDNAYFSDKPRGKARLCQADPIVVRNVLDAVVVRKATLDKTYDPHKKATKTDRVFTDSDYEGYMYDFGINSAGLSELTIYNTTPGQVIEIQHCDFIDVEGRPSYRNVFFNANGYSQRDIYICKGAEKETFVPPFTYHGFRCCFVHGLREDQVRNDTVRYLECSSDLKSRGGFSCSDEVANRLQGMCRQSDISNFFYFPNDCPQREKNGWTGDVTVSCEQFLLNYTVEKSLKEWLYNVRAAQDERGAIPGVVPTAGWGFKWGCGPIWDNVLIEVPYQVYRYTGDKTILSQNAHAIFRYLNYASNKRNERGLVRYGLGDWVKPKNEIEPATVEFVDSVMIMDFAQKAAAVFGCLSMNIEKNYALSFAEELRKAIKDNLIDDENVIADNGAETAYVLALRFGLFDKKNEPTATKKIIDLYESQGGKHDCGMIGLRFLFHVLAENGYADFAYETIVSDKPLHYGNFVKKGLTTMPENLDLYLETGDPKRHLSINHHFLGDISNFFISRIAGIRVNQNFTDAANIDIEPTFISSLKDAKADFVSVCGKVESGWERKDGKIVLTVNAPEGVYGEIKLPKGTCFEDGNNKKPLVSGQYAVKVCN